MTAGTASERRAVAAIAALALAWLVAMAWPRPLMLPDEGRYVGVAWEMMRSGDWLVPTLNGLPYFHKPPLFYWVTAAAMSLLGPSDWAARAAPLLGAWVAAMAVFVFVRRWWGDPTARRTLAALLTQPLFYLGGQFANLDMLVAACVTVTIVLLAHAALAAERGLASRGALAGAYAAAALGVLAKGLIGAVLPALVIGAWLALGRRWGTLRRLAWLPGAALFLVIAAPWFVLMQWYFAEFTTYFFGVQHFRRFTTGGFNNPQPFWFYPAVLLLFTLPWLPWLRPHFARGRLTHPERGDLRLLMVVWVAVIVVFFSLPRSKLLGYVLPAVPPLAVLLADGFESRAAATARAGRGWWLSAGLGAAISLVAVVFLAVHPQRSTRELAHLLRAQHEPRAAVYMVDAYPFDVPMYARLQVPVGVVLDWTDPGIRRGDGWRKELADAARFAPARSRAALLQPDRFASALCTHERSWVLGPSSAASAHAMLAFAHPVSTVRGTTLWRVDPANPKLSAALRCPGTPNAD